MWFLILAVMAIVLFMLWATRKPFRKPDQTKIPAQIEPDLPWALQKHHVSAEALTPFEGMTTHKALLDEMLTRMGRESIEDELTLAVLFGLEIALQSDDYGKVGIEFEEPAFIEKQLQKLEFELFDNELYGQYQFYSHSLLTLQDMLEQHRSPAEKTVIRDAIRNYSDKIKEIQPNLKTKFSGMDISEIGTRKDREIFYFKMAVTNYLRGKDIIPELDRLYYAYGLNYQIDEAFQKVTQHLPLFEKMVQQGLPEIARYELIELQQYIRTGLRQTKYLSEE